jgi:iron(III) transport system substrate-binding protein
VKTEKTLAAGPAQSVGLLPESIAADVRPDWIPRNPRIMDVDWAVAVKSHSAATKAIKELLLDQ